MDRKISKWEGNNTSERSNVMANDELYGTRVQKKVRLVKEETAASAGFLNEKGAILRSFRIRITAFLCLLCCALPIFSMADMGPKPSVSADFHGVDKFFYATLLSRDTSTGPWHIDQESHSGISNEIFEKFRDYQDVDGFHFLGYLYESRTNDFYWGYYPPDEFKFLLYFPEEDKFIVSEESYTRYAFYSSYEVEIENDRIISVKSNYDYLRVVSAFFARVAITIAVELFIVLCFGVRKLKSFGIILVTNFFTQGLLNVGLSLFNYYFGFAFMAYLLFVWIFELTIFIMEGRIYKSQITELKRPYLYSFVANLATYLLGFWAAWNLPALFP